MIKSSFSSFNMALSRGFIENEDVVDFDEMYLDPYIHVQDNYFITDFKIIAYSKPEFPITLNHLKPFIKFQKSKTRIVDSRLSISEKHFDKELWDSIWKHLIFQYLHQTFGKVENPWGSIDSTELNITNDSIYSYYEDLKWDRLKFDSGLKSFLDSITLPEEFSQAALINNGISKLLFQIGDKIENNNKSQFIKYLKEKGTKWAKPIEKMGLGKFWLLLIKKSNESNKPIEYSTVVLYSYLLSIEIYLKRLDIDSSIKVCNEIISKNVNDGVIQKEFHFEYLLTHFVSKLYSNEDLVKKVQFFPDYLLLNYLSQNFHEEFSASNNSSENNHVDIYAKLKKNLSKVDYLSITGKPVKSSSLSFQIKSHLINQINYLPPYMYRTVLKDLLLVNIELYGFTKKRLGISPDYIFKEFELFKEKMRFDLSSRFSLDDWLESQTKKLL
jgi:hypothetical protein